MSVNSNGYIHLGGNIRNIYILLLLSLSFGTVTDIDGNVYETIQIGEQVWMAENLKTTHYNDGSEIPTGYSGSEGAQLETGAYAVYDDDPVNADVYGNLYNWYTVDDSRGICPENYHIPTDDEWYILLEYLGGASYGSGENWIIAGGKMKDVGTIEDGDGLWYAPNEGATNESGFTAIPIQVYNWIGYPQAEWKETASAGIILLLGLLLIMNSLAIFIRNRYEKDL